MPNYVQKPWIVQNTPDSIIIRPFLARMGADLRKLQIIDIVFKFNCMQFYGIQIYCAI